MADLSRMTATTSTVSSINQTAIVRALRDHGPMSRVRIGELTGLSPATVNRLTVAMLEQGLIVRDGQQPSTGGRPSLILRYTGGSRVVAALQLRGDRICGALVDFGGNVVDRHEQRVDREGTGADRERTGADRNRLELTLEVFDMLVARAERLGRPCTSVGVSVPGVVSDPEGRIGILPELGWPEMPLGEALRGHTSLPVVIENDANALAYGEFRRGAATGVSSMVALLLDNGMGAGIVTNGAVHRGRHSEAGEIGYLLMERSSLRRSYTDSGDLEDRVGSVALTRAAVARGIAVPEGTLFTAHDIIAMAEAGDPVAAEMTDEILDMVSMALAAMSVILDPEAIVVGSGISADASRIIPQLQERLEGRIIRVPRLLASALGDDGVLLGVAELAINEVDGVDFVPR